MNDSDNTPQLQNPPNENSCAWQQPCEPAFALKRGQCFIRKTRGCIISGFPDVAVGDVVQVPRPIANELVALNAAIFCTQDGKEITSTDSSSRRGKLLKSIQLPDHPRSRPGDI